MPELRAVFFDLDDTLVDGEWREDAFRIVAEAAAPRAGRTVGDVVSALRAGYAEVAARVEDEWVLGRISGAERYAAAVRAAFGRLGVPDGELVEDAAELFVRTAPRAYRPFADVHDALWRVRLAGLACGVITNGAPDAQRAKLEALGLKDRVDVVVISGELGIPKPDPRIFDRALALAGVGPDEAAHVGDSLRTDVAGADGAGLVGVWINRAAIASPGPTLEIASLAELPAALGY